MQPATEQPTLDPDTIVILSALAIVVGVAMAVALIAGGLVRRLLARVDDQALAPPVSRATVRAARIVTFFVASTVLIFPALDLAGITLPVGLEGRDLLDWLARTGVRIAVIVLLVVAVNRLVAALIGRAQREITTGTTVGDIERQKRALTIGRTVSRFLSVLVWAAGTLMVLRELDVDITPLLTGAGILGLAVGFGAQTLVRDVISGFFLILEDQVRVGDLALVNGTGGLVEQINLRTIVLRDLDGTVHVFPNGEIKTLANRSKDFSYAVVDVGIDYHEDIDKAVDAVRAAAVELQADPKFGPAILEPIEVLGVDDFKPSAVDLKFRMRTVPLRQWDVGRELRRRIKQTFDARGIRIPYDQLEVTIRTRPDAPSPSGSGTGEAVLRQSPAGAAQGRATGTSGPDGD
jgi:small conductance mechanosensitive channel